MATIVEMIRGEAVPRGRTRPRPARYMIDPDDALQLVLDAAVRSMGAKPNVREVLIGRLTEPVHPKARRTYFVPAEAARDPHTYTWSVRPTLGVSSADIFRSCRANCYLQVPPGCAEIPAGETLSFSWIAGASATY